MLGRPAVGGSELDARLPLLFADRLRTDLSRCIADCHAVLQWLTTFSLPHCIAGRASGPSAAVFYASKRAPGTASSGANTLGVRETNPSYIESLMRSRAEVLTRSTRRARRQGRHRRSATRSSWSSSSIGCGKTTTLRMVAVLEDITSGEIAIATASSTICRRRTATSPLVFQTTLCTRTWRIRPHGLRLKIGIFPSPRFRTRSGRRRHTRIQSCSAQAAPALGRQRQRVAVAAPS